MIRFFTLGFILFLVAASQAHSADNETGALFRGVVVPLSAAGKTKSFARSNDAWFSVRLRVTEIFVGRAPLEKGKDYVFNVHSIVGTFGRKSLQEVEGQEFIWYLIIRTTKDGTPVARLYPGESFYEDFKKQQEEDKAPPTKSP